VGFYAGLTGINAYHQPGVEAGKKAAAKILELQTKIVAALGPQPLSAEALAAAAGGDPETVSLLLEHLAANGRAREAAPGAYARA
jgi:glucose-6-phosphate isomerase